MGASHNARVRGGEYQRQVTGAPKDIVYVVPTDKMPKGEKKFDGWNPETRALLDAEEWNDWPPNTGTNFDTMINKQVYDDMITESSIAQSKGVNLEWHVPTEEAKNKIMKVLGEDLPSNFSVKVTLKI